MASLTLESAFKGKTVLITGAARGVGRGLVQRLYGYGATIYALSRNENNLKNLQTEFPNIHIICVDLEDWDKTKDILEKNIPDSIDCLINNAGVSVLHEFLEITSEIFDKIINTNLKSVVNVSQVISKKMIKNGKGGSILNISSLTSKVNWLYSSIYGAGKAALDHLTRSMARELGQHGIRVNAINPGYILTDMIIDSVKTLKEDYGIEGKPDESRYPLGGKSMIEMDQIVNSALFLLSDMAPMIHGSSLLIDGGYTTTS